VAEPICSSIAGRCTTIRPTSSSEFRELLNVGERVIKKSFTTEDTEPLYNTRLGCMYVDKIESALESAAFRRLSGKVDLLFTSPPFPLIRKKRYGNETGEAYIAWLESLAPRLTELLSETGSIVMEVGNSWVSGTPVMSTLSLEALLAFKKAGKLHLCQHIICHNPARLPGPAQWVNVERIRLKDSFTHVWWMARTERPKADNKKVLIAYSEHMKRLLKNQSYNAGKRPSGHVISEKGFLKDRGGAIAPSVLSAAVSDSTTPESLLKFSGTAVEIAYREYCERKGLETHPARMQSSLAAFFIQFLTDENDLVLDPFAGSNTTGAIAEALGRRWIGVEANEEYARGSKGRFAKYVNR
jgi:site-specific DNA-methyltransferase (cytosine-N4-specific)